MPNKYPIPNIQDFSSILSNKTIFLVKGISPNSRLTTIITPTGLLRVQNNTFGLCNATQSFQCFMDKVLRGLEFCLVYLDNVLVASESQSEHLDHLGQVFNRLKNYGIILNSSKYVFEQMNINFLDFMITSQGISPSPSNIEIIKYFPTPVMVQELSQFLFQGSRNTGLFQLLLQRFS